MDEIVYQCPECNFNADNLTELDNHMDNFHTNNQSLRNDPQNDHEMNNEVDQNDFYDENGEEHNKINYVVPNGDINVNDNHDNYNEDNEDFYIENNNNNEEIQNIEPLYDNNSNNSYHNDYDNNIPNGVHHNNNNINKNAQQHNLRQKQALDYKHLNNTSTADIHDPSLISKNLSTTLPTSVSQMTAAISNSNLQKVQVQQRPRPVSQSQVISIKPKPPQETVLPIYKNIEQPVINSDNHYERQYTCKRCGFFTNNPRAVLYHRKEFHFEKINIHECSYCQYASQYSGKVERHTLLRHKIDANNTPKKHIINKVKMDNTQNDSMNNSALNLTALGNMNGVSELDLSLSNRSMNQSMTQKPNIYNQDLNMSQNNSMNINSPMMITKYQCNKCPCKYKRSNDLSKHLKMKHNIHPQKLSDYLTRIPIENQWGVGKMDENNDLNIEQNNSTMNEDHKDLNESGMNDSQIVNRSMLSTIAPKPAQLDSPAHSNLPKGTYECPYCTYYSNGNDAEYLLHVKDHLSGKSFRCVLCNSVYKYRGDCVVHLKRKHQKADMFAQNYVERFNLEAVDISQVCCLLKPKQTEETENEEKLFGCAYCDYKANYKGDVFKHQTRRHQGSVKNVISLAQSNGASHHEDINRSSQDLNHSYNKIQHSRYNDVNSKPAITSINTNNVSNQNNFKTNPNHPQFQQHQHMNNNNNLKRESNNVNNSFDIENEYENSDDFYYNNSQINESTNYSNYTNGEGDYEVVDGNETENDIDDTVYNQPDEMSMYDTDPNDFNYENHERDLENYENDIENENGADNFDYENQEVIDAMNEEEGKQYNMASYYGRNKKSILASVLNGTGEPLSKRPDSSLSSLSSTSFNSNNMNGNNNQIINARRRSQHALRERKFKCSLCPRTSKWQWDIRKHMRTVHRGQEGGDVVLLKDKEIKRNEPYENLNDIDIDQIKSKCAILNNRSRVFSGDTSLNRSSNNTINEIVSESPNSYSQPGGQSLKRVFHGQPSIEHQQRVFLANQGNNQSISAGSDSTGNKKFKCISCPYRSNWKADLFRHLRKRHYIEHPGLSHVVILDSEFAASTLNEYERLHGIYIRKRSRTELDCNGTPLYLSHNDELETGNDAKREKLKISNETPEQGIPLVDDIDQQNQLQQQENNIELFNRNNRLPVSIAELNIKPYKCLKCGFRSDRKSDTLRHIRVKHNMTLTAVKYLRIMSIKEASDSIEEYENMRLYKKIKNFNTVNSEDKDNNGDGSLNTDNLDSNTNYSGTGSYKTNDDIQGLNNDIENGSDEGLNICSASESNHNRKKCTDYYRCPFCSFKNVNKHTMRRHLVIHFSGNQSVKVTNPVYRCSLCTFRSKWQFFVKKHITTHHLSVRNAYVLRYPNKTEKLKKVMKKNLTPENSENDGQNEEDNEFLSHQDQSEYTGENEDSNNIDNIKESENTEGSDMDHDSNFEGDQNDENSQNVGQNQFRSLHSKFEDNGLPPVVTKTSGFPLKAL